MEISYFTSFSIGTITLIIIYIFNWFKFRSNLNFLTRKLFECICPCCCKKKLINENINVEGDGKNVSDIILEKVGLLIRTHPYGKSGIQGIEKLKFIKINKARFPDFSNIYDLNYINFYQYQMMLNETEKKEEKIVNQIYEYEGNNKFKDISNLYTAIPNSGIDKSILFKNVL